MNSIHVKRYTAVFLFLLCIFIVSVWGFHEFFTSKVPGANDFYPRWRGAQLFWQDGVDPYSQAATEAIQRDMYGGRLAYETEDQVLFVYPFYVVFFLRPLTNIEYSWVQAIWLVLVQFSLLAAVILNLKLFEWKMPPWLLALTLLWAVIFYNSTRTIILGQFAGLLYLWIVGTLLALKYEQDVLAGLLLSLTTIKPQMSYLLIPALLIWALGQKRWRFIVSSFIVMVLLVGFSFLLQPNWLVSFIDQVLNYPGYTITGSPLWVITGYYFPQLGKPVEYLMIAGLLIYLFWNWRSLPKAPATSDLFLFVIGLTLIVTNMIVIRTATTNYIIMYVPLFMLLHAISQHMRRGNTWVAIFYGVSVLFTWVLFILSIDGDQEHPITYLPLPFFLLMGMIWYQRTQLSGLLNNDAKSR